MLKGPDEGKSVVRSKSIERVTTTVEPPDAPTTLFPDVVVIVPVDPSPPDTV